MKTLAEMKGRCRIDDEGHWIWTGAGAEDGHPRIYAPDYTRGGAMRVQNAARAVWHAANKRPLPEGHRAFNACGNPLCINPKCIKSGTAKEQGAALTELGHLQGQMHRILANRRNNQANVKVTPEVAARIHESEGTNREIAERMGLHPATIGLVKLGKKPMLRPIGGLFSGLMAHRRAA